MTTRNYSIIVVGGGMVGLTMALLLAQNNFSVAVIEAKEPMLDWQNTDLNARVSAINAASQAIFQRLGVWQKFNTDFYAEFTRMQVWDMLGGGQVAFDSIETGHPQLGHIVENREVVRRLWQACEAHQDIDLLCPATPEKLSYQSDQACITLADETVLCADLVIGADGANSWVRQSMPTNLVTRPYDQQAIVAVIETEKSHRHTAYQAFLPSGPLGILPLSNLHHSAIVWSANHSRVAELLSYDDKKFNRELGNSLNGTLGRVKTLTALRALPLTMRHAQHYVCEHVALVGDAAHTIHPLAGQGVNLGLLDAACLAQCLLEARKQGRNPGSLRPLRRYERWRKGHNSLMITAMRGFKEVFASQSPALIYLRSLGFDTADRLAFVKKYFMSVALGETDDLPEFAKSHWS